MRSQVIANESEAPHPELVEGRGASGAMMMTPAVIASAAKRSTSPRCMMDRFASLAMTGSVDAARNENVTRP